MGANTIDVTDAEFSTKVLKSPTPVIVDFWAPWCGPCRAIAPVLDELAGTYKGRITVAKINVDDNPLVPSQFGVRGIPTMIFFKGGEAVDQIVGAVAKAKIQSSIDRLL